MKSSVLSINSGSSSIKFALYDVSESLTLLLYGGLERIGTKEAKLNVNEVKTNQKSVTDVNVTDRDETINFLIDELEKKTEFVSIKAIGHRIVHGMKHTEPERITPELLSELKSISAYSPEHLPQEIKLIEAFEKRHPALTQIACFDTSFHTTMPPVAKLIPIPRRFSEKGIHRYGFHGLSYSWIVEELKRLAGSDAAKGRLVLAHLGNGASLAAVKDEKSIDTSMGFTPASGLPMGTRTGDIDPGVAWYLIHTEKLNLDEFSQLINHQSGLLGISETSADMRELLKSQSSDSRAAEAIDLFCYQTKKWIGAYTAVLGGLDTLVFSGGIGEHAPEVRARICDGLQFLGIELDESKNLDHKDIISTDSSRVTVRVIKTNEEWMIARLVCRTLNYSIKN